MRAVRYHEFGGPNVLRVDEIERPRPAADEVLVAMRAASVNPVDVMIRGGEYGQVPLPTIPGGDGAGVVESVGRSVDQVSEGERVVISGLDRAAGGTFAEYATVPQSKLARAHPDDLGATATLPYHSDTLAADVRAITEGNGVDTVLDHRLAECLAIDFEVLADGGQVVSLMGHVPETNAEPFHRKEIGISALRMDAHPVRSPMLERVGRLMQRGDLTAVVADQYDLEAAAQAHQAIRAGGFVGKLIVTP